MRFRALCAVLVLSMLWLAGCQGLGGDGASDPGAGGDVSKVKHIIVMYQENRSFDHYFGKLGDYRQANGIPGTVDGLPATASNPGYDPTTEGASTEKIESFRFTSVCHENVSPAWSESLRQYNLSQPESATATMDGFVVTAANFARNENLRGVSPQYTDIDGRRAMGYYDQTHLPYYYFLASRFATSDRWFSPVRSRSAPNRLYSFAATSAGYAHAPTAQISNKTIFDQLEEKGVSWKIYYTDANFDGTPVTFASYFAGFLDKYKAKIVPVEQYFTDLQNGTLPSVAMIESGYISGKDEHPVNNIQEGAAYVKSLVDALMKSTAWKESVFILTYDEGGGMFDHVAPPAAVHPDGIAPIDLTPIDFKGDFDRYGFRMPVLVISPFSRAGFVSHTPMDFTATLRLIQSRHGLPSLTKRDASQPNMSEFFNFDNPPFLTPPQVPDQPVSTANCYHDRLP